MGVAYFNNQKDIWQELRGAVSTLAVWNDIIAIQSSGTIAAAILPWRAVTLFAKPSCDADSAKHFRQSAKGILADPSCTSEQLSGEFRETSLAALGYGWQETIGRIKKGSTLTFKYCERPAGLIVPVMALDSVARFPYCHNLHDQAFRDIAIRAVSLDDYHAARAGLSSQERKIMIPRSSTPLSKAIRPC